MGYVAHGTVQVKQQKKGNLAVLINPIPEYRVKHKDKEYTVLVQALDATGVASQARIFPVDKPYEVDSLSLGDTLKQAAFSGIKVELEVEFKSKPEGEVVAVVAVLIPATSPKL
ncbi:MAG TPA: hypothetical protein VLX58_02765 [Bryobacteraceae bacterium]|nr:hypothetical protein [Bryobacteraceae bacterium]